MWQWEQLLQEEFEDPFTDGAPSPELETFYFNEVVQTQQIKFELDSFWGTLGGGLEYFEVITVTGEVTLVSITLICKCVKQICANRGNLKSARLTSVDPPLLRRENLPASTVLAIEHAQVQTSSFCKIIKDI